MSTFTTGKASPNQSGKSQQQVIHDDNSKRRTLLQDNSWIKTRPEESNNENYGRVVLNQYKSQDSLHSNLNEKEDKKILLVRYRSDTALDRISDRRDADKSSNSSVLDNRKTNRQSWTPSNTSAITTTTPIPTTTSPVKHKRQSWMPPPVSGYKNLTVTVENKGQSSTPPNTTTITTVDTIRITSSENSGEPKMTILSSEQTTPPRSKSAVDNQTRTRNQNLDALTDNSTSNTKDKGGKDLDDLTVVNTAEKKNKRGQGLDDLIEVKTPVEQNRNRTTEKPNDSANAPSNRCYTKSSYDNRRSSNNASTSSSSPKDTVVYTRTYEETSKSPNDAYEKTVAGKSIKTVYSTSDWTIIEKEMCTYCRKPLGIEAKMILNALQICCHSTCFKCEVCKKSLEDLKAGDSIWIYKNTVHCEPCYSKIKEKWIY
ncbi:sciellin [Carettochelys insculpta]|uniref:sciellin n=1 Tax=Carettochelys insculpta TaxID=44489 RepID=UPI003EB7C7AC